MLTTRVRIAMVVVSLKIARAAAYRFLFFSRTRERFELVGCCEYINYAEITAN